MFFSKDVLTGIVNSNPELNLPLGNLRGHILKTYNGKEFFAFEGIPYAKPPIGDLRFEEPQPIEPWNGTVLADRTRTCIQYRHYRLPGEDPVKGDEDCLYLNVYTPKIDDGTSRNVIIYIHGGAFMFGSGGNFGPLLLLDQNIVYVTLNYRLGPIGFLSTEDEVISGNYGLKDQSVALKWIKNNIKYFGGNSDSITLTGMSAGGASVHFHAMSSWSKGLFHRGVSQSGTALNPWVIVEESRKKSQMLAAHLDCPTESLIDMKKCLKEKSAYDIVSAVNVFQPFLYNPISPFGIVIDKWSSKPFLNEHPYALLQKGKIMDIPWIFSNVESEGLYPGSEFISDTKYLAQINDQWNQLVPFILDFNYTVALRHQPEMLEKIRNFYFADKEVSEKTFSILIQMMSDRLFNNDISKAVKLHSPSVQSPIYYYYFSYRGQHSKSETLSGTNKNFGASHGDDTVYILSTTTNTRTSSSDKDMTQRLINVWLSFASDSVPKIQNIEWLPVSKQKETKTVTTLHIESPYKQKMIEASFGNSEFWDSLPLKENEKTISIKNEL
ncbi:hypothetical protein FQR65_LT04969 [Abscondita terminalis]|nr:hypothetical protein FQR65_LT04969 [Abscondita terminalis]